MHFADGTCGATKALAVGRSCSKVPSSCLQLLMGKKPEASLQCLHTFNITAQLLQLPPSCAANLHACAK